VRLGQITAVLGAAALAVACGGSTPPASTTQSNLPNVTQIQAAIAQTILKDDHVNAQVYCPTQVPEIKDETFSCVGVARQPRPQTFVFLVTEHGGTFVSYVRTA
jgi:hypothetical protein